jgi:diacylglycerol kinase (ATP)
MLVFFAVNFCIIIYMKGSHSVSRIYKAFGYSLQGLKKTWKTSPAFREECIVAAFLIPTACYIDTTVMKKLWLIFTVVMVLIIELINTAIESAVDRIGVEHHPLSGQAKDISSAAVLLSMLVTLVSWVVILFYDS